MSTTKHWAEDPYWTDALSEFVRLRDSGDTSWTLDIRRIEEAAFSGDSPAYRLMDAMISVKEHEGMDGCRGAPRLLLALLVRLKEISESQQSAG
jgi:hypothetical protein